MHNHYIINGIIEFHPTTSTLRELQNPEHVVVLNSPAGRCLLLLIKRVGHIVTQQEFMDIVWAKSGMQVSPNTYYQNISILRKGLKKFDLKEDLVVTIPRIGLTLASGTRIQNITNEKQKALSHDDSQIIDVSVADVERQLPLCSEEDTEDVSESIIPFTEPHVASGYSPTLPAMIKPGKHSTRRLALLGGIILVAVAFLSGMVLGAREHDQSHFFSQYRFLTTANGCHIFVSRLSPTATGSADVISLSEQLKSSCSSYPWMYVTHYSMLPRVSIIRCSKPISDVGSCISDYFFRGE